MVKFSNYFCKKLTLISIRAVSLILGLMKTDDLKILFKSSKFTPSNIRFYILNLIQKFEVALTWDNRTLLIPSLLPDEYQLRAGYPDCEVKVFVWKRCFRMNIFDLNFF